MSPGVQYVNTQPQIYTYDYYKDDGPDEKPVELLLFLVAIVIAFIIIYGQDENGKISSDKLSKSISDAYTGVDQQKDEFGRKKNVDSVGNWMKANPLSVAIIACSIMGMAYNYYKNRSIFTIPFRFFIIAVIAAILMAFFENKLLYMFLGIIILGILIFMYSYVKSYFVSSELKKRKKENIETKPDKHLKNIKLTIKEYIKDGDHKMGSFQEGSRLKEIYNQISSYVSFHKLDDDKMKSLKDALLNINKEIGDDVVKTKTLDEVTRKHHVLNYITGFGITSQIRRIGGPFNFFGPTKIGEKWYGHNNDGEKYLTVEKLKKIA